MVQETSLVTKLNESIKCSANDVVFLCIGTDRVTGDCLGPLVGHLLTERFPYLTVYGTLQKPVHAQNMEQTVKTIKTEHPKAYVVAIDACLSRYTLPGTIVFQPGPLRPGNGIGKNLPEVGDVSIIGVVNRKGENKLEILKCTRLSVVMNMAQTIVESIGSVVMQ